MTTGAPSRNTTGGGTPSSTDPCSVRFIHPFIHHSLRPSVQSNAARSSLSTHITCVEESQFRKWSPGNQIKQPKNSDGKRKNSRFFISWRAKHGDQLQILLRLPASFHFKCVCLGFISDFNRSCCPSAPPRGWERNAMPPPLLSPPQQVCLSGFVSDCLSLLSLFVKRPKILT